MAKKNNRFKQLTKSLGPGVITGAADDDPSGIATYSQTGAQFGFGLIWSALYLLPLMIAVQEACARIGAVKGKGLTAVFKKHFSKPTLIFIVVLLVIANTINVGADIGAMVISTQLIFPVDFALLAIFYCFIILLLEVFVRYKQYVTILKLLCLFLLAYPLTLFMAEAPWGKILAATFIPHVEFNFHYFYILTGLIGTTISPYLFFWQASQEVEERKGRRHYQQNRSLQHMTPNLLNKIRFDNFFGMLLSEFTAWSIIVVTAVVLHENGVTNIETAADAARALEPFVAGFKYAGFIAKLIFSIGVIGLGLLSIPVLAGSAAYALCEALDSVAGLDFKLKQAPLFYAVIIISTLLGLSFNFIGINPINFLIFSAVINGLVAVPLIFFIGLIAQNETIMGRYKSGIMSKCFVWLTFVVMCIAAFGLMIQLFI